MPCGQGSPNFSSAPGSPRGASGAGGAKRLKAARQSRGEKRTRRRPYRLTPRKSHVPLRLGHVDAQPRRARLRPSAITSRNGRLNMRSLSRAAHPSPRWPGRSGTNVIR